MGSSAGLACHASSHLIAYPAGCVIVIENVETKTTQTTIVNQSSKKPITALAFSNDAKYIASGESGDRPSVRVWEIASGQQFCHFEGHDHTVAFLVSC